MDVPEPPSSRRPWQRAAAAAALLAIGLAITWRVSIPAPEHAESRVSETVRLAIPALYASLPMSLALERGYFDESGPMPSVRSFTLGAQGLRDVIEGHSDLALVTETPFMFAVMRGADVKVLATIYESRHDLKVVARRDRGIAARGDLRHKRIGVPFGINAQFFLDSFLLTEQIAEPDVTLVNIDADRLVDSLMKGEVDAVAVWNPLTFRLREEMADQIVEFPGGDVFSFRFLLVGSSRYVAEHAEACRRVLAVLARSTGFLRDHRDEAAPMVTRLYGIRDADARELLGNDEFGLHLDQTLLLALEDQTRWALRRKLVQGSMPNYLDRVELGPLNALDPAAVRIIH